MMRWNYLDSSAILWSDQLIFTGDYHSVIRAGCAFSVQIFLPTELDFSTKWKCLQSVWFPRHFSSENQKLKSWNFMAKTNKSFSMLSSFRLIVFSVFPKIFFLMGGAWEYSSYWLAKTGIYSSGLFSIRSQNFPLEFFFFLKFSLVGKTFSD